MRKFYIFIFIVVLGLQMSCTSNKKLVYMQNMPKGSEKIITQKNAVEQTLQIGDVVYVRILSINKEINELFNIESGTQTNITSETTISLKGFTIDNQGYIRLPVIDTVKILGLNTFDAEKKIQLKVNEYFKNATVMLKLLNSKISVLGEVNRPGSFIIYKIEINILEAISLAGDISQIGDRKNVVIVRTIGNENVTYRIDLTDVNLIKSKDFYLLPNDIVVVEPLKLKSFRMNTPTISLFFSGLTALAATITLFLRF